MAGTTFPSPAGYPILPGTPVQAGVTSPLLWDSIVTHTLIQSAVAPMITEEAVGEITGKGCQLYRPRAAKMQFTNTAQGADIPHPLVQWSSDVLTIDKAYATGFAVDNKVQRQSNYQLMAEQVKEVTIAGQKLIDTRVLADNYASAATGNFGPNAGINSQTLNLGDLANNVPLVVNPVNGAQMVTLPRTVLDEQEAPEEELAWFVLPPIGWTVMQHSDLKAVFLTGDSVTPMRTRKFGTWNQTVFHKSVYLPQSTATVNGQTVTTYVCPFGLKRAITFAMQAQAAREGDVEKKDQKYYDMSLLFGYKVFQPEVLGYMYLSFAL